MVIKAIMMLLWSWEHLQLQSSTKHSQVGGRGGLCLLKEVSPLRCTEDSGAGVRKASLRNRTGAELEGYEAAGKV